MNFIVTIYEEGNYEKSIYIYCKYYFDALKIKEKLENSNDIIVIDAISKKGRLILHKEAIENLFIIPKGV